MGAGVPGVSEDEDVPGHGVKNLRGQSLRNSRGSRRSAQKHYLKQGLGGEYCTKLRLWVHNEDTKITI